MDKDKLIGSWRLSEIMTFDKANQEKDGFTRSMLGRELLSRGLVLHFYPDSSFTELEGYQTSHGNWSFLNEKQIRYGKNRLTIERFEQIKSNNYLIASIYNKEDKIESELKFVEDGKKLADYKTDPFYPDNNKWRQRPLKKETNEEIRARLLNYILHYAYLLNASIERDDNEVSFAHSMGLIQVFQGGIGRIPKNKINKSWIECFYDEEDAIKAFYLFSSYLNKGVYNGGSTGNWAKDDYEILMTLYYQIQKKIKEDEEKFAKQDI
ncbi:MAG: hypothetical protein WAU01_16380 [Saprospiraceae bacterium]